jgi:DNA-binding transcriptional LysR family regulator
MELRHLRYLVAVADAGTFVRAAELLRVAQPALSRQINDLEAELEVELFEDGARKATLTDAGHAAVRIARHVLEDTERAVARARMSNEGLLGTCTLTTGPVPLMTGIVPQVVARLRRRHPSITVVVRESAFPPQWHEIADGAVDIGLGAAPPASFQALSFETQMMLTVDVALLPPEHPLVNRESIKLADLKDMTYLGLEFSAPDTDAARDMLMREYTRQKIEPGKPRLFPSIESLLLHVRAGQGWTILPRLYVNTLSGLRGPRIEDFQAPFRIARIWRRADKRAITRTVLNELRALQQEGFEASGVTRQTLADAQPREFVAARLDLRHLRSFVEIGEVGSLGRAAETLDVSQPALSRQMRELEYDVGVTLLERGTRGVALTAPGEAFRSDALAVLAVVDRLPAEVRRAKRGSEERRCVIGTVSHPAVDALLTAVITEMESRSQRVRVGARSLASSDIPKYLRRSEVDLAIAFAIPARTPHDVDFARRRLMDDELSCAVLPAAHPLASAPILSLHDLADLPFVFPTRDEAPPPLYDVLMHQFDAVGARPRTHLAYSGIKTITAMVAQGLGWAIGTRSFLGQAPPGTAVVPLSDFKLPWGIELLYRKDESRPAILATMEAIVEGARQMFSHDASGDAAILPHTNASKTVIS